MKNHKFEAVIFDLDGVITKTALVHSRAWTRMFNDYLKQREEKNNEKHKEFTHEDDYLPFVDGKPRYNGVADFLKSRDINIPFGKPSDPPEKETACGLGNRKNDYFTEILNNEGVEVYGSTVKLIKDLEKEKIHIGVASSSKNCKKVLEAADLMKYFETRVDGVVSAELGLKGKPEPDIFTTACDNLGIPYDKAVVVEDAVSGVQAGAKGGFAMTLGVAREDNVSELRKNGADIVVEDIAEVGGIDGIDKWIDNNTEKLKWSVNYNEYEKEKEKSREALLTVGNGFFATRGSMEEVSAGENNYPGSYMDGLYNRKKSKVAGRMIENEDFVNFINWLPVNFRPEGENWFHPEEIPFELIERRLDLKTGILYRSIIVTHKGNKKTRVDSRRFISMNSPHLGGLEYSVTPLNYSGNIELMASIDGNLINDGVARYRDLEQNHLEQIDQGEKDNTGYVIVKTNQSEITIAAAEKLSVFLNGKSVNKNDFTTSKGKIESTFKTKIQENETLTLRKLVWINNSKDFDTSEPLQDAIKNIHKIDDFQKVLQESIVEWSKIWDRSDLRVEGDRYTQMLLRMHIFHLIVTASPFNKYLDAGIPARGLHGEAYRGHIFWDELYILPFYISRYPETARSILMYRYRRLNKARNYAKKHGFEGAMFPWQSGSDGREETQVVHLNPVSGEWGEDYSSLQRHISIAIAYNIWQYYQITSDQEFMNKYGAEMFFDICRFWASKAHLDEKTERYSIDKVMGPDEFHEKLPDSDHGGLKDNAYTNIMVVWCMDRAFDILEQLDLTERKKVVDKLNLTKEELIKWKDLTLHMNLIFNEDDIIAQFEGYFDLRELNWDAYREKYEDIHRMDRILKAEGNSPDEYKVAKQADTLMTYYNIDPDEVDDILSDLGYEHRGNLLKKNFDYYLQRTSHGSTLSRVVHAYLAKLTINKHFYWDLYLDALESDYVDIQGGTTSEGIHAGVMGGTVLSALNVFAGLNWHGVALRLNPDLPSNWKSIYFKFWFHKDLYQFNINNKQVHIYFESDDNTNGRIFVRGKKFELKNKSENKINL